MSVQSHATVLFLLSFRVPALDATVKMHLSLLVLQ
jgi:hypothetical protein